MHCNSQQLNHDLFTDVLYKRVGRILNVRHVVVVDVERENYCEEIFLENEARLARTREHT